MSADRPSLGARRGRWCALCGALLLSLCGCGQEAPIVTDLKQISDPLSEDEFATFERIVNGLPEPHLKDLPDVFLSLPQWQDARTLPVNELAAEEERRLEEAWQVERIAPRLAGRKGLARLLRRERVSVEHFISLTMAVAAALSRAHLPENSELLDKLIQRSGLTVDRLHRDQRLFSSLTTEGRYHILDDAVWLHRVSRAKLLQTVPAENVALVRQHADWLKEVLPKSLQRDPFADLANRLEERGLPFVELPQSGSDDQIEWSAADALVGN